ncbi:hypothetical protein Agub_g12625, partial [Astrephomene gubernaculifera]
MALQALDAGSVGSVAGMLRELQVQGDWRVRYGGFCGLKYTLAARLDLAPQLLPAALPLLRRGLADPDDDVRAACADALVPVAGALRVVGPQAVSELRAQLWDLLPQLSDLSAATNSVMSLLAHLYGSGASSSSSSNASGGGGGVGGASEELTLLVPRLWPFVRHTLSTVRASVMQCLERMLSTAAAAGSGGASSAAAAPTRCMAADAQHGVSDAADAPATAAADTADAPLQCYPAWLQPLLPALLQLVFQNVMVESETRVLDASVRVWRLLVRCAAPAALQDSLSPEQLAGLLAMGATQVGRPLDPQIFMVPYSADPSRLLPLAVLRQLAGPAAAPAAAAAASTAAAGDAGGLRSPKRARTSSKQKQNAAAAAAAEAAAAAAAAAAAGPGLPNDFIVGTLGEEAVARMRTTAASCLGALFACAHANGAVAPAPVLLAGLSSSSATARQFSALTARAWLQYAKQQLLLLQPPNTDPYQAQQQLQLLLQQQPQILIPQPLLQQIFRALSANSCTAPLAPASLEPYSEVAPYYAQMRREVLALVSAALEVNVLLPLPAGVAVDHVGAEHAAALVAAAAAAGPAEGTPLALACSRLRGALASLQALEQYLHVTALASLAAACVHSGALPDKFNTVIQPLMNCLRREPQLKLQEVCADGLAELLALCCGRTPSPNDKLVRNIAAMATADLLATPGSGAPGTATAAAAGPLAGLQQQQQQQPGAAGPDGNGDPAASQQLTRISRRGGEAALVAMARRFEAGLWQQLPTLWTLVAGPLATSVAAAGGGGGGGDAVTTAAVGGLHILRVLGPALAAPLLPSVVPLLGDVCRWVRASDPRVRQAAARCASTLARCWTAELMPELLKQVVPMLSSPDDGVRLGGVEVVSALCGELGAALVPYVVLLLVPLLRRMSDPHAEVRAAASSCFGALMTLLPLAQGVPTPPGLDGSQLATVQQDSAFLLQLLDNRHVASYDLPFQLPYTLRPYQQDGINWLAFLRRFGLHGVLADDMGLGKTLQASCIMAAASLEAEAAFAAAASTPPPASDPPATGPSSSLSSAPHAQLQLLPCLVVCPATLVGHWVHEVNSTIGPMGLRPLAYGGLPSERAAAQSAFDKSLRSVSAASPRLPYNMLVMSYESLRADIDWVASRNWLYCVLDEGHAIRNPRSRVTVACKRIVAQHRLLLSGTPIQNDVLEMWSLFDFLMPGFLGPERAFRAKFGKALQEARVSKRGSREAEAGLLALEGLHRSLLPFVLRRSKGQVLADLPPKIVTDIYCDMSELQARLYEDFRKSKASAEAIEALRSGDARRAAAAGSDDTGG